MKQASTKTAAEAVLRELPSVLGAYVSEGLEGRLSEIHLLVQHGPDVATLARDVHGLLEERLGIRIDHRVISIAQLAPEASAEESAVLEELTDGGAATAEAAGSGGDPRDAYGDPNLRPIFSELQTSIGSGRAHVTVRLTLEGQESEGSADAVDTHAGRARAAASATIQAAVGAQWNENARLELDFASLVHALDGEYALVSVLSMSPRFGRRPLPLVGAHPVESDVETAAALATLKAINRVLGLALRDDR